jgi:hypothetical protein
MSEITETPLPHEAVDHNEQASPSGFVIAYAMVAMSGALVGFLAGWLYK